MTRSTTYLYRDTTVGWPGSAAARSLNPTCTSTDPFVATLFAIEARNKGEAVVFAVPRGSIAEGEENHFRVFECAVNLRIDPAEFGRVAEVRIDVARAVDVLESMGFRDPPVRIVSNRPSTTS